MNWRLPLAHGLALSWAAFWLIFFIAESWAWKTPLLAALPWVGAGVLFVGLALLSFRWDRLGGLLLVIVGLSAGLAYAIYAPEQLPIASRTLTTVVFSVPPLAAGMLLLTLHRPEPHPSSHH